MPRKRRHARSLDADPLAGQIAMRRPVNRGHSSRHRNAAGGQGLALPSLHRFVGLTQKIQSVERLHHAHRVCCVDAFTRWVIDRCRCVHRHNRVAIVVQNDIARRIAQVGLRRIFKNIGSRGTGQHDVFLAIALIGTAVAGAGEYAALVAVPDFRSRRSQRKRNG